MTLDHNSIRFLPCGDTAFSMEFGKEIDRAVTARVIALYKKVGEEAVEGVLEMIPAFRSLLVLFDPERIHPQDLQDRLMRLLDETECDHLTGRRWRLPVSYGGECGPDLAEVARDTGLSEDEVWQLHAGQNYFVYMIGFLPGYPYMGDIVEPIRVPRRPNPRIRVPRGSVAIAQAMTAIYSLESPGGWQLIGRTPVPLFDPKAERAVLLSPGDTVTFEPISARDFVAIEREFAAGTRVIEAEDAA